jgi:hypothetical protein
LVSRDVWPEAARPRDDLESTDGWTVVLSRVDSESRDAWPGVVLPMVGLESKDVWTEAGRPKGDSALTVECSVQRGG